MSDNQNTTGNVLAGLNLVATAAVAAQARRTADAVERQNQMLQAQAQERHLRENLVNTAYQAKKELSQITAFLPRDPVSAVYLACCLRNRLSELGVTAENVPEISNKEFIDELYEGVQELFKEADSLQPGCLRVHDRAWWLLHVVQNFGGYMTFARIAALPFGFTWGARIYYAVVIGLMLGFSIKGGGPGFVLAAVINVFLFLVVGQTPLVMRRLYKIRGGRAGLGAYEAFLSDGYPFRPGIRDALKEFQELLQKDEMTDLSRESYQRLFDELMNTLNQHPVMKEAALNKHLILPPPPEELGR